MFDDELDDDDFDGITEYNPGEGSQDRYDPFCVKNPSAEDEPEEIDPDVDDAFANPSFTDGQADDLSEDDDSTYSDEDDTFSQEEDNDDDDELEKTQSFYEHKISPQEAEKRSVKPKQINKRFLSIVIICAVGGIFIIAFLMPTKAQKQAAVDAAKKVASKVNLSDYAAMANRQEEYPATSQPIIAEDTGIVVEKFKNEYDEDGQVIIPPLVVEEKKPVYEQSKASTTGGGGGAAVQVPDTRNDSLQEKRISGIKGLSSTQQTYSTNYAEQVEKNVASTQRSNSYTMPTQQEFMNSMLNAYSNAYGSNNANANVNNPYSLQNDQAGKNSFYNNGRNNSSVGQGQWLDYNTIWQGTIIEAVLTSEMNTDLPGEITARVAKNVYSSQDGRFLLIPQNSILYGSYNSSISYAQSRVQVGWHTLIRPDGYQVSLGNMNATDAKGASGLKGFVNDHPMAYLKAIGLMSVFSIVNSEFQASMGDTNNEYVQNIIANTQQMTNELGEKLIDRAMNVQPTIKVKAGTKINVVANQTMAFPPCEELPVTQAYRKY